MKRQKRTTHPSGTTSSTSLPKYTIGIVSQILGLPPQALRRYEAAGLLEPARQTGKNRLYSDQDIAILQEISELSEQGVNTVGIRYILQMRQQIILLQEQVKQAQEEGEEAGEESE